MKTTQLLLCFLLGCLLARSAGAQRTAALTTLAPADFELARAGTPEPAPAATPPARPADDDAWRLDRALGLPDWLELDGHQRTRYESFDEHFRAGRSGSGQGFFTRTALRATARRGRLEGTLELLDSRQFDTPDDLPLGTSNVNPLDVLQLYVGGHVKDVWHDGDELSITLGRHTMDVGSRRLVARNRFRNTINAFTGLNATWEDDAGSALRAFYVFPVQRLPTDLESQRDNEMEADEERTQVRFYGLHGSKKRALGPFDAELYAFGLDEDDGSDLNTRNRDLLTVGGRLRKPSKPGATDYELELAYQTGETRASTSDADTTDLDVDACFFHASAGYQWDARMKPHLEVLFDYASGDDDPTDGEVNRFDTLFGARRFEFGPTGIFGAFARANILSPGLRLNLKTSSATQLMVTNRLHYLASDKDAWTTSGLVDPTGDSGDYVGDLLEARVRWDPHANLRVEVGAAHLFAGDFVDDAPNATTQGDTTYGYLSTTLSF